MRSVLDGLDDEPSLIVAVRERATARIYARLTRAAGPELAARLLRPDLDPLTA